MVEVVLDADSVVQSSIPRLSRLADHSRLGHSVNIASDEHQRHQQQQLHVPEGGHHHSAEKRFFGPVSKSDTHKWGSCQSLDNDPPGLA